MRLRCLGDRLPRILHYYIIIRWVNFYILSTNLWSRNLLCRMFYWWHKINFKIFIEFENTFLNNFMVLIICTSCYFKTDLIICFKENIIVAWVYKIPYKFFFIIHRKNCHWQETIVVNYCVLMIGWLLN